MARATMSPSPMNNQSLVFWVFALVLVSASHVASAALDIGINWGTLANNPLPEKIVVQMLKDNGIKKVKLFDADKSTVKSLANTGIEVTVAVPNMMLDQMAEDYGNAKDWVKENVTSYLKDVNIKYVAVGNEPFLKSYNGSFNKPTLPALQNIQKALNEAGHNTIKAIVPQNADVYDTSNSLPSGGAFRSDIKDLMHPIVKFLKDNNSPFVVNIYPFISLSESKDFPIEFAFFEKDSKALDDKGKQYHNLLDASYDTLVNALKKAGAPNLKIVIGEIGWPTDGNEFATKKNAQAFYHGLFKKLSSKEGTPVNSNVKWDVFLFGLLDEDTKSTAPGNFERHWGIFYNDGRPKFPIDFSGSGNKNKWPVGAKGVQYLSQKWCIFDKSVTNTYLVKKQVELACQHADCSNTMQGGSCSKLDSVGRTSYIYNQYYQLKKQDEKACDFEGTALIVKQNASQGDCLFPIQFSHAGERLLTAHGTTTVLAGILLALFLALF